MVLSIALIILGLVMPALVTVHDFGIIPLIHQAILEGDSGYLLMATFKLVLLNALRALPHYLGVFLLAEFLVHKVNGIKKWLVLLGCLALIPLVYMAIELVYGIRYDFGGPALIVLLGITALHYQLVNYRPSIFNKALIIILILAAVQSLDVVPAITTYGFGRGEISLSIKEAGAFLEAEPILYLLGATFFVTCSFSALALGQLMVHYNRELVLVEQAQRRGEDLHAARLQALHSRSAVEIQGLVHDLKTPLTSIQGLAGVIQLKSTDSKIIEYAHRIEQSVDQMNEMVGEILHHAARRRISPGALLKYTLAHLSSHPKVGAVEVFLEEDLPDLLVNRIRLTRALVNFLNNALAVIPAQDGWVKVYVEQVREQVTIIIKDNGPGMDSEDLSQIWDMGFSTHNSLGLGLPFARSVVVDHGGTVTCASSLGQGCEVRILLPGGEAHARQAANSSC